MKTVVMNPKSHNYIRRNIQITPEMHKRLKSEARREKVSIAEIVRVALEMYLK
jgi:predicted HicB family RNase H-like nuclease